jgi:hypothetical protein
MFCSFLPTFILYHGTHTFTLKRTQNVAPIPHLHAVGLLAPLWSAGLRVRARGCNILSFFTWLTRCQKGRIGLTICQNLYISLTLCHRA